MAAKKKKVRVQDQPWHDEGMNDKERAAFLKRLREVRGERSQRQWAIELGEFQQTVNRYERGEAWPHLTFLNRLAKRDNVDLTWLVTGKAA